MLETSPLVRAAKGPLLHQRPFVLPLFFVFFAWAFEIAAARDFDMPSERRASYVAGFLIDAYFFPGMRYLRCVQVCLTVFRLR